MSNKQNTPKQCDSRDLLELDLTPVPCPDCDSTNCESEVGAITSTLQTWCACGDCGNKWVEIYSIKPEMRDAIIRQYGDD